MIKKIKTIINNNNDKKINKNNNDRKQSIIYDRIS